MLLEPRRSSTDCYRVYSVRNCVCHVEELGETRTTAASLGRVSHAADLAILNSVVMESKILHHVHVPRDVQTGHGSCSIMAQMVQGFKSSEGVTHS